MRWIHLKVTYLISHSMNERMAQILTETGQQASAIEAEHNNAHRNSAVYMLKVVE